ncbi:hypothetical protein M9Y10_039106 [Tritrichomonas musculus]|uniref:Protein kinase domain-containing protein n=1 Tax=Tritrichomonas musculus TaxID=1915356 RepID=A0ABR2KAX5_9EUKA
MSSSPLLLDIEPEYILKYEDLTFEERIGAGSFGEVWTGRLKNYKSCVAIKKLHITDLSENQISSYRHEVSSLNLPEHSFIVPFIGCTLTAPYCIVTKYIPNDSLYNALRDDPKKLNLTPTDLTTIAFGIADGMKFLHSKGITHRDLKSQNILIDENKLPVICDFGSSRKATSSQPLKTAECGTTNYMAPEFIKAEAYTNSVDVYSYGMILWEMLTKKLPFENSQPHQIIYSVLIEHKRPTIPAGAPEALASLIKSCWSDDSDERPSFSEILKHLVNGDVSFEGTDQQIFSNAIKPFIHKRKSGKYIALPRYDNKKKTQSPNLASQGYQVSEVFWSDQRLLKTSPISGSNDLIQAYLISLSDLNTKQIDTAINYLLSNVNHPALLRLPFWYHVLRRLVNGRESDYELVQTLAYSLAQNMKRLEKLSQVTDLHKYVAPQTLDVFLFVVEYAEQLVTPNIIQAIEDLCDDPQQTDPQFKLKPYILLAKILSFSKDTKNIEMVNEFLQQKIMELVEIDAGAVALRALVEHDAATAEQIKSYLLSSNTFCIIAGYRAIFYKNEHPNLLKVETLSIHIVSEDEDLRNTACEFVRRFGLQVKVWALEPILDALLTSIFRYSSDNALLLICCFAVDDERAVALLKPKIASIWLNSSIENSKYMMRFFAVLFRQEVYRKEIIQMSEVPQFLCNVLRSGNPDAALAVCWVISLVKGEREFLVKLKETPDLISVLVKWFCTTKEPRAVLSFTTALYVISECAYSEAFNGALQHLMNLVNENNMASLMCLNLMVSLSCYRETLNSFIDVNAFMVLGRYKAKDEKERLLVKNFFDNLKKAGLVLPS